MIGRVINLLLAAALVAISVALVAFLTSTYSRNNNVIRLAHDSKENSPLHQALLVFEQQVEAVSNGRLAVEIYPGGQLGGVRETTELVRQGNLQMTTGASVLLISIVPEFSILDRFYLFDSLEHAHLSLDHEEVGELLLEQMADKGLHGLGYMEVGFRSITTNRRPIEQLEDLQDLKIRAASNPVQIDAWEAVGTAPTPLSWSEIFTSLQQGLINTQESAIYSIYAERFYEAQRYLSITEHIYTNYVVFMNRSFWDGLAPDDQSLIEAAARTSITRQRELAAEQNRQIITELENFGMQVNRVSEEVRAEMKTRMNKSVESELRLRTGPELHDRILQKIAAIGHAGDAEP